MIGGVEVRLEDGRMLRIRVAAGTVVLEIDREVVVRLTRPEAWQLAEALDAVATRSGED